MTSLVWYNRLVRTRVAHPHLVLPSTYSTSAEREAMTIDERAALEKCVFWGTAFRDSQADTSSIETVSCLTCDGSGDPDGGGGDSDSSCNCGCSAGSDD